MINMESFISRKKNRNRLGWGSLALFLILLYAIQKAWLWFLSWPDTLSTIKTIVLVVSIFCLALPGLTLCMSFTSMEERIHSTFFCLHLPAVGLALFLAFFLPLLQYGDEWTRGDAQGAVIFIFYPLYCLAAAPLGAMIYTAGLWTFKRLLDPSPE